MPTPVESLILDRIRSHGPLTVAEFMELALYHPEHGYYSRATQRSGCDGDFFTSVDVGPMFGELVAAQIAEMWSVLGGCGLTACRVVEAGAGNGRLARDILDAARRNHPDLYARLEMTLVERAPLPRDAQRAMLAAHADRVRMAAELPASLDGILLANELLDALPTHVAVMTRDGPREVYVAEREGRLQEIEDRLSSPAVAEQLARSAETVPRGCRVAVGLAAVEWMRSAAARLRRGFLLLFDYGFESGARTSGVRPSALTAYRRHHSTTASWFESPGERDLTAHVDLTAVRTAAEHAGLATLGIVDQTYFVGGLIGDRLRGDGGALARRLQAKMLLLPGGLGSTMKVLAFGRNVGRPALSGLSSGRLT